MCWIEMDVNVYLGEIIYVWVKFFMGYSWVYSMPASQEMKMVAVAKGHFLFTHNPLPKT